MNAHVLNSASRHEAALAAYRHLGTYYTALTRLEAGASALCQIPGADPRRAKVVGHIDAAKAELDVLARDLVEQFPELLEDIPF